MKTFLIALALMLSGASLSLAPSDAEAARRLGGGKPAGMQRQTPPPQQPAVAPRQDATPTAPAAAPTTAAAPAGKRSWLGPVAGLAAGLGLAALFSHFGLGEGLAQFVTLLLLAVVAFMVIRWLMRRFAGGAARPRADGLQYAGAGAPYSPPRVPAPAEAAPLQRGAAQLAPQGSGAAATPAPAAVPPGFDASDFERIAKMIFIRLQAANDAGEVEDLRRFTTPELFASLRLDLQERGGAAQQTDVVQLQAQVLDTAQEDGQWIVSVRFHGLIREETGGTAEPFDELWHLVKPVQGERDWAIAGITPVQG